MLLLRRCKGTYIAVGATVGTSKWLLAESLTRGLLANMRSSGTLLFALSALLTQSYQQENPQVDLGYEIHEGIYNVCLPVAPHHDTADPRRPRPGTTSLGTYAMPSLQSAS